MPKKQLISILNEISTLLPINQYLEIEVIEKIQIALCLFKKDYLKNTYDPQDGTISDIEMSDYAIAEAIEEEFEELDKSDFSKFKLTIGENAIRNFRKNIRYSHSEKGGIIGVNSKNDSIRLIAAFLVLPEIKHLHIESLECHSFVNLAAINFYQYMNENSIKKPEINPNDLIGIYNVKKKSKHVNTTISIKLDLSSDNTHLIIEETFKKVYKSSKDITKNYVSYGWGIISQNGIFQITLKDAEYGDIHSYSCPYFQYSKNKSHLTFSEIILIRTAKSLKYTTSAKEFIKSEKFNNHQSDNIFVFKKGDKILTFPKQINDKNNIDKDSECIANSPFMKPVRDSDIANQNRKDKAVNDQDREKLGLQLINAAQGIDFDFDRVYSLLDSGAPVNFQDPDNGATIIHYIASGASIDLFESIKDRAHEEINHLIRDNKGRLPSLLAGSRNPELRDILMKEEVNSGRVEGKVTLVDKDVLIEEFQKPLEPNC